MSLSIASHQSSPVNGKDHVQVLNTDIVEDLGLDLSSVTRAFYRQIVRENRIPLSLSRQPIPAETLDALDEVREKAETWR